MVTTHDSARARAYTADLVSPGVRSRVSPRPPPAPPFTLAECGMSFPYSAAHQGARNSHQSFLAEGLHIASLKL